VVDGGVLDYRCLVEHRYSPMGLLAGHSETEERTLWAAALVLEEAAVIAREVGAKFPELNESLSRQADEKLRQAAVIRGVLQDLTPFRLD
jgi:hypothetical protein